MARFSFGRKQRRTRDQPAASALGHSRKQRRGRRALYLFFGFFGAFGMLFFYMFFIRPVMGVLDARDWRATPCTIISSEVSVHDGDDNNTYSVDITYRYEVSGRVFTSDRYSFVTGSSSGRSGKQRIVNAHRPGSMKTCYVNPADPQDAVLNRGMTAGIWVGLMAGVFPAIGFGGIIGVAYAQHRRNRRSHAGALASSADDMAQADGALVTFLPDYDPREAHEPVTLSPVGKRIGGAIALFVFAAFWNGVVSIFANEVVQGHRSGNPQWFLTIFLIPFLLVGIAVVGFFFYALLGLLNPRPVLMLQSRAVEPGEYLDIRWQVRGNARRMRHMAVELRGREEATYRRGTDSITDKQTFAVIPVMDTSDPITMSDGSASAPIPRTAMHSMNLSNNRIIWSLHVTGTISRFPDVNDEYTITVLPRGARTGGLR